METNQLHALAKIVLPSEVLVYFDIVDIESNPTEIYIHLDEKMIKSLSEDIHFEPMGFLNPVQVTDFPIRDHKVILVIRRRCWVDIRTGKSFSISPDLDIASKGSRYSKEFAAFLKEMYETSPVTCRTLEDFYNINAKTFDKQYKDVLSGYRDWEQLSHAEDWLVFPKNIGPKLAIDETSRSNGELYTFVTNRDRHGLEQCLVTVVAGTKSDDVIQVLKMINEADRETVNEVTMDLSDSMRRIVKTAFPKAKRVIDRFHIQKLACEAVQEIRIAAQ